MQYNREIDRAIIEALLGTKPIRSNELQRNAEKRLKRRIVPKVFSRHLGKLLEKGLIAKTDFKTIPPRVEYSLTEKARKQYLLSLLGENPDEKAMRLVFREVLLRLAWQGHFVDTSSSEEEVNRRLAAFGLSLKDFNVEKVETWIDRLKNWVKDEPRLLKGLEEGKLPPELKHDYERTDFKPVDEIAVCRIREAGRVEYLIMLPNLTVDEMLEKTWPSNKLFNLEREKIVKALKRLCSAGLLSEETRRNGEKAYRIKDPALKDLLFDLWNLSFFKWSMIILPKIYLERPSAADVEFVMSRREKQEALSFFLRAEETRKGYCMIQKHDPEFLKLFLKIMRDRLRKDEAEYRRMLKEAWEKHAKTVKKYDFLEEVFEAINPDFLKQEASKHA